MDLQAAERLAQRAALIGVAQAFYAMFTDSLYWDELIASIGIGKESSKIYTALDAYWETTVWRKANAQPCAKWTIQFRPELFGTITIEFHNGELRRIRWQQKGREEWHMDLRQKEEPRLLDVESFLKLVHKLSSATARYVVLHKLPRKGNAVQLLHILK